MKKKDETRYFVTAVASVPVYKFASKTEIYRMATKPGWGAVEWYSAADGYKNPVTRDRSDKTQQLCCDEDTSASLYMKNGGYFEIFPYEEINVKEMPKQAACAAIIYSDSYGYSIWAEDFNQIHIFATYDVNGLIDSYRVEYGDSPIYDGEVEISFEDLYQQPEGDWKETYRAELPGTVEYKHKQEAAQLAETAGATWMDADQQEQFRRICNLIDKIKSGRDFYHIINKINNNYEGSLIVPLWGCTTNQSYTIGSRTLTRADLAEIRNTIKYWTGVWQSWKRRRNTVGATGHADHAQGFIKDCPPLPVFSAIIGNVKAVLNQQNSDRRQVNKG